MTVKELIKALNKMPQDLPVRYWNSDYGWIEVEEIKHQTYHYENPWAKNPKKIPDNFIRLSD